MKAEITADGKLRIRSEKETEAYAIKKWLDDNAADIGASKILFICANGPQQPTRKDHQ